MDLNCPALLSVSGFAGEKQKGRGKSEPVLRKWQSLGDPVLGPGPEVAPEFFSMCVWMGGPQMARLLVGKCGGLVSGPQEEGQGAEDTDTYGDCHTARILTSWH